MTESNIILINRSRLFREGLRSLFEQAPFKVVMEGSTLPGILPELDQFELDEAFILVEWLPDDAEFLDGIERLKALGSYRIVALTDQLDSKTLVTALQSGARALVLPDISLDALSLSLELVRAGEVVFPSELAEFLVTAFKGTPHLVERVDVAEMGLTDREVEILKCLVQGHPNKVIANRLALPEATVKFHLKNLLRKVKVSNRTEAAIWGLTHGVGAEMSMNA